MLSKLAATGSAHLWRRGRCRLSRCRDMIAPPAPGQSYWGLKSHAAKTGYRPCALDPQLCRRIVLDLLQRDGRRFLTLHRVSRSNELVRFNGIPVAYVCALPRGPGCVSLADYLWDRLATRRPWGRKLALVSAVLILLSFLWGVPLTLWEWRANVEPTKETLSQSGLPASFGHVTLAFVYTVQISLLLLWAGFAVTAIVLLRRPQMRDYFAVPGPQRYS